MEEPQSNTIRVFVSYAHADRQWLERLQVHLKPLGELRVDPWDDRRIRPGSKWREEIRAAVKGASIAVLLISADFLASDFIKTDELPPLLKAAEEDGAIILPIIVSPCLFLRVQHLSQFQAVNDPAKPLVCVPYGDQEAVMVRVAEQIWSIAERSTVGLAGAAGAHSGDVGVSRDPDAVRHAEDFLDPRVFTQLIKIGDWIFDQSKRRIVGSGMNAFLVSRNEYGEGPFTARAVLSFSNFAYPQKQRLGMNAGLIFGWKDEKQKLRYYNVVLSGTEVRLERIGFEAPPAPSWRHLTDPAPLKIEPNLPVELVLRVDERISVEANGRKVVDYTRPTGVVGRVGLRPWRSQLDCTEFVVSVDAAASPKSRHHR